METMAKCLSCTENAVRNWLKKLSAAGWVEIEYSKGRHPNSYRLVIPSTGVDVPSTGVEGKPSTPVDPTINTLTKNNDKKQKAVAQRFVTDEFSKRFERESGGEKYPWSQKDFKVLQSSKILLNYTEEKIGLCIEAYFYDSSLWFNKNGGGRNFTQMIAHWGELLTSSVVKRGSEKVLRIVSDGNGGVKKIMAPRLFADEA